jgi:hypothetical protein
MGMFDYLVCEYALPKGFEELLDSNFQTKSLSNTMSVYVITEDGGLVRHTVHYEDHPTIRELDGLVSRWQPARVPVKEERIPVPFHGDIEFVGSRFAGRRWERMGQKWVSVALREHVQFRARFNEGKLSRIDVLKDERGKYNDVEKEEQ